MHRSTLLSLVYLLVLITTSTVFRMERKDVGAVADNLHSKFQGRSIPRIVPVYHLKESAQIPIKPSKNIITTYPPWANLSLLLIGQKFLRDNFVGLGYGIGLATVAVTTPDIIRVVLGLGGITQPKRSKQFITLITLQLKYWSIVDLVHDQDNFLKSLNPVHAIHAKIDKNASESSHIYGKTLIPEPVAGLNPYNVNIPLYKAFKADLRNSRLRGFEPTNKEPSTLEIKNETDHHPVNQFALAIVLWSLVHATTIIPSNVFIYAQEEEIFGFIHFMALIGTGIGIEDKYNPCLQPDLHSAKSYFSQMFKAYILPPLFNLEYEYIVQIEATLLGVADIAFPFVDESFMMLRFCEDLLQIKCPAVERNSSFAARFFNMVSGTLTHTLFRFAPVRSLANFISNGLINASGLRNFNYNTFNYESFTCGVLARNKESLARF